MRATPGTHDFSGTEFGQSENPRLARLRFGVCGSAQRSSAGGSRGSTARGSPARPTPARTSTPVQHGNIVFEPDRSKGNRGPQGYAKISSQGTFDTGVADTGPCPGPQVATIEAYPDLESPASKKSRVVLRYRTHADLPAEATTRDFDVPASAARKEAVSDLPPP